MTSPRPTGAPDMKDLAERRWLAGMLVLVCIILGCKVLSAHSWPLLADEAYYWVWSLQPAWGYFDQPPAIAWVIAGEQWLLGRSELALRAIPLAIGASMVPVLWRHVGDRSFWLLWTTATPPLAFLTLFATPDALLLGAWALGLGAALRGGRGWWVAGLAGGLAGLCKLTGLLLVPLLVLGAGPKEWREARVALLPAALVPLPWLVWNANHDWVSIRFPLSEGLRHPHAPGLMGPLEQIAGQVLVLTPVVALVALVWMVRTARVVFRSWHTGHERLERLAWAVSAPVALLFLFASVGGPPEAHWPAPAWIGVGVGLSHATGRLAETSWIALWLALFACIGVGLHGWTPLGRIPSDPGGRLTEGAVVSDIVRAWSLPEGVGAWEPGVDRALPVFAERYQEAALVHWGLGIAATVPHGCGRPNQYDLWPSVSPDRALLVKPATSGSSLCTDRDFWSTGPHRSAGIDQHGRSVGTWDIWELER